MGSAVGAKGFALHIRAAVGLMPGVIRQFGALWAKSVLSVVPFPTIKDDHLGHNGFFPLTLFTPAHPLG